MIFMNDGRPNRTHLSVHPTVRRASGLQSTCPSVLRDAGKGLINMLKAKKWVALCVVAVLCFSLTGCLGYGYDTVGTINGEEIPAGIYLVKQMDAYEKAKAQVEDQEKSILSQKIDGQKAKSWIADKTEESLREYIAIQQLCAEKEVFLSSDNISYVDQIQQYWEMSEGTYTVLGIAVSSLRQSFYNSLLGDELFKNMYGEGGEREKTNEQMQREYEDHSANLKYITIPLNVPAADAESGADATADSATTDAADVTYADTDKVMEVAEKMLKALEDGKSFEDVAAEYLEKAYEYAGSDFTDTTVEYAVEENYFSYGAAADEEADAQDTEFRAQIKEMKVGDFGIQQQDASIMVYKKVPLFEDEADFETNLATVRNELYYDEFKDYLKSIYDEYTINWKFGVRSYYSPSALESNG